MKQKSTPVNQEIRLGDDDIIVSKTDTKGQITYANRIFMKIAGYAEPELLGVPHNILRHPDMPRGVFKMMWATLQSGNEFFGYVKNQSKDGRFYWVLANVTPDRDAKGQLRGYYSVRRKPAAQAVATVMPIYQQMLDLERQAKGQEAMTRSLAHLERLLNAHGCDYTTFVLNLIQKSAQS